MYLLDTNVISELRRPERAPVRVLRWSHSVSADDLYLSAISFLEIEVGALRALHRDPRHGAVLRTWIDEHVMPAFAGRILNVDAVIAQRCAALHVPDPKPYYDALIAATALVHGLQVVTRNLKDFAAMGVPVVNPFEAR